MESVVVGSLMWKRVSWNLCCGVLVVASFVVESLVVASFVVESSLWSLCCENRCCGICVV